MSGPFRVADRPAFCGAEFCVSCGAVWDESTSDLVGKPMCLKCAGPLARFATLLSAAPAGAKRGTIGADVLRELKCSIASAATVVDAIGPLVLYPRNYEGMLFGVPLYLDETKPGDYMQIEATP